MIEITLDSETEPLDLLKDTSIEIILENPILGDTDKLSPGSYSIPFSLPAGESSPKNARQFKHADIIENASPYLPTRSKIKYDSIPFKEGTINVDEVDTTRIDTYFLFGLSSLKDDFKTKRIRDLLNETVELGNVAFTKKIRVIINADDPDTKVKINDKEYSRLVDESEVVTSIFQQIVDDANDGDAVMAELDPETPENVNGYYGFYVTRGIKTGVSYVPSTDPLTELAVTCVAGADYSFHVEHNLDEYYDALNVALFPYFTANEDPRIFFSFHSNPSLYDRKDILFSTYVNLYGYEAIQFIDKTSRSPQLSFYPGVNFKRDRINGFHSLRPFVKVKVVIDKILEYLGVGIEGDFYDYISDDAPVMGLDNSFVLDTIQDFCQLNIHPDTGGEQSSSCIFFQQSFNLSQLAPDVTVVDFLKAFALRYNLAVYHNEQTGKLVMQFREPIARSKEYQIIDSISGRKGKIKNEATTGYKLSISKVETDSLSVSETVEVGIPSDEIPIPCAAFSLPQTFPTSVGSRSGFWINRAAGANFSMRILWYRGVIGAGDDAYPFAHRDKDFMNPENLQAIHDNYHKYWMRFKINKRVMPLMVNWTMRELRRFNWKLKRRYSGSDFLVKSIRLTLTTRGMQVSQTELITQR